MRHRFIVLSEPDASLRREVAGWLETWGYTVLQAKDAAMDASTLASRAPEAVIAGLPERPDAVALAELLGFQARWPEARLIVLDHLLEGEGPGHDLPAPSRSATVHARPLDVDQLAAAVGEGAHRRGVDRVSLTDAPRAPDRETAPDDPEARLAAEVALWCSPAMRAVWEMVQQAAQVDVTVLISGETGTGKDVVARAIHQWSARRAEPFVRVNCAAVPRELLESELFGHERGAFTGAHQTRIGKFESANGGTVFLDEIGDLHPALQAKLLHVLQDGAFSRVGGRSTIKVDVRVLAATNKELERAVADGRFRDDLFYRLNVIHIVVPPLRERMEEIPVLTDYFVRRYAKLFHREAFHPSPVAMERLLGHSFPGNVRELENVIKRMIVLSDPLLIRTPLSTPPARSHPERESASPTVESRPLSLKDIGRGAAQAAEREAIARVLQETGWNRTRAAKQLKISYRALLYKIKYAGLNRLDSSPSSQS